MQSFRQIILQDKEYGEFNECSNCSDDGELLQRMEFEYELTFRFDTETLEVFDMQKNGENVVKM